MRNGIYHLYNIVNIETIMWYFHYPCTECIGLNMIKIADAFASVLYWSDIMWKTDILSTKTNNTNYWWIKIFLSLILFEAAAFAIIAGKHSYYHCVNWYLAAATFILLYLCGCYY